MDSETRKVLSKLDDIERLLNRVLKTAEAAKSAAEDASASADDAMVAAQTAAGLANR